MTDLVPTSSMKEIRDMLSFLHYIYASNFFQRETVLGI